MTRLLPPDMHLVYCAQLQPYSPDECDPDLLENGLLHLDGEFKGVAIPLDYIENMQECLGRTPDETISRAKEKMRDRLIEYSQSDSVVDPMGMREYEGDTSVFNMSREELQREFNQLCEEFDFPANLVVKIALPFKDTVFASTGLYGMPRSNRPHLAMVYFFPLALSLGKPYIRSVIRHEFAHCLADAETWPTEERSSDHFSPVWHSACEQLGIMPDANWEPREDGYIQYSCPSCGDIKYLLYDEEDFLLLDGWDECCEECGAEYDLELRHEPLAIAESGVYIVQEDGRELSLGVTLEEMLPWCLL